ncbi:hypothetical protein OGATHE_000559 [Ogataea polymorpha]|uniref:Uncharacterized protein n=1 Tax=Ogataea polymorpha TaxID=460523 RepID=A0A9P8PUK0_9ASCO|nr:hypothetical protein OGATHE_000559 [Ogataea polymorpha]
MLKSPTDSAVTIKSFARNLKVFTMHTSRSIRSSLRRWSGSLWRQVSGHHNGLDRSPSLYSSTSRESEGSISIVLKVDSITEVSSTEEPERSASLGTLSDSGGSKASLVSESVYSHLSPKSRYKASVNSRSSRNLSFSCVITDEYNGMGHLGIYK